MPLLKAIKDARNPVKRFLLIQSNENFPISKNKNPSTFCRSREKYIKIFNGGNCTVLRASGVLQDVGHFEEPKWVLQPINKFGDKSYSYESNSGDLVHQSHDFYTPKNGFVLGVLMEIDCREWVFSSRRFSAIEMGEEIVKITRMPTWTIYRENCCPLNNNKFCVVERWERANS